MRAKSALADSACAPRTRRKREAKRSPLVQKNLGGR